ncbi:MAG: putative protein N(5)-glutamine methyltransferase, partial [Actinomycetales bacterium]
MRPTSASPTPRPASTRTPSLRPESETGPTVEALAARLRAAGCVFAEDEARLILQATDDEALRDEMVRRRADGAPLEVLLGWAELAGVRVSLRPGVFVPRRRSALLVAQGLGALGPDGAVVVDLCCGSGALGLALARSRPDVE